MTDLPPPYQHQSDCLSSMDGREAFALLMEMGTGKTRVLIDDWLRNVSRGAGMDLAVVAPAGMYRNWETEILHWAGGRENVDVLTWRSGASKKDLASLKRKVHGGSTKPTALLVNVEALSSVPTSREVFLGFSSRYPSTMLAVDESTTIKNHKAARTKFLLANRQKFKWRRIMSGLVAPRSPLDVFSQFNFLDPAILGFRSYYAFRARYAVMRKMFVRMPNGKERPVDIVVNHRNVDELWRKIAPHSFRVTKDVLGLPPKIYMAPRHVELTDEQKTLYSDLKRHAFARLDGGGYVTTDMAVTMLLRMHQIACGYVVDELGREREVPNRRLAALMEVLEDHSGKAIIWAPYRVSIASVLAALREEYGKEAVVDYWGDTSSDDRVEARRRFQEDPACRFFVGNPATGGKGLTLTAASLVVYYANSWDLEHRMQSEDRAHRAGLTHSVAYVDLTARGTVDEKIVEALRKKMDLASLVTGENLREWIV